MRKQTIFILMFLPWLMWAHQDRFYTYEYENVTVRFKTGFFFEEVNNARIIGKYAALLADSMGFKKPIFLDFIHDYGHNYRGKTYSFLNFGSEAYDWVSYYKYDSVEENVLHMVPYSDTVDNVKGIIKEVRTEPGKSRKKKIVIRQFGHRFNVTQTMNLIYYAITQKEEVKRFTKTDTLHSYLENTYYRFESIPGNLVDSITSISYPYVENILQTQVYREEVDSVDRNRLYFSYFLKNGKYLVFAGFHDKEIILDTLQQVYSFHHRKHFPRKLFVFETPDQFRSYDLRTYQHEYDGIKSKRHKIPIDPFEHIVWIDIEWIGDDIFLIKYDNSVAVSPIKRILYLSKEDILIEDFDAFIDSYRNEKK